MAEQDIKKIIFSVDVENDDFLKTVAQTRRTLKELKEEQKAINTDTERGAAAYELYESAIKQTQGELRKLSALQKSRLQIAKSEEGSNVRLREQLKILTADYNNMSQAQRETTQEGQMLANQISEITAKLKENESAVGDNRRNVGNYKEAIVEAGQELKVATAFTDQNRQANLGLRGQMEAAAESASALAGTFALLSTLTKDNEEAQKLLEKIMLAVAAATAIANIAKSKGQILDTAAFIKTKALIAIQTAYNAVLNAGTVAAKAFKVALAGLGIGAVIAGITLLVSRLRSQKDATDAQVESQENLNEKLDKTAEIYREINEQLRGAEGATFEQIKGLERLIELRKAQGASTVEILRLREDLINARLRENELVRQAAESEEALSLETTVELEQERLDLLNDRKIIQIELNEALAEELRITKELEEQRNRANKKAQREREEQKKIELDTTREITLNSDKYFEELFQKQRERNEQARKDANTKKQLEALESLAEKAEVVSGQVGAAFAASLTEAGLNVEDFTRRLLVLTIDTLQRKLLVAIAETYFDQIKEKGFAGIVTGSALTALLIGVAESAKAALSKPVKFAQGGEFQPLEVGGRLHSQGGTMYVGEDGNRFEVERGEKIFITNRKASSFIGAIAEINKAFGGKGLTGSSSFLRDGGFAANSVAGEVNGQFRTAQLAADIVRGLPEFVVSVSEIDRGLAKVRTVENVVSI